MRSRLDSTVIASDSLKQNESTAFTAMMRPIEKKSPMKKDLIVRSPDPPLDPNRFEGLQPVEAAFLKLTEELPKSDEK